MQFMEHPDKVNTSLRFDKELHQRLVAEAKRSLRSLNGEVVYRLRESIDREWQASRERA
jgi:predicted HicB family RNase H-like nuclease